MTMLNDALPFSRPLKLQPRLEHTKCHEQHNIAASRDERALPACTCAS